MRRGMMMLSAAALTLGMAGPVMAQYAGGAAANMDYSFFDSHPNVARALRQNPSLIDDPNWVAQHPALQHYLNTHPNVRHDFKDHPYWFMHSAEKEQPKTKPGPGPWHHDY